MRRIACLFLLVLLSCTLLAAATGAAEDPGATLSYVQKQLSARLTDLAAERAQTRFGSMLQSFLARKAETSAAIAETDSPAAQKNALAARLAYELAAKRNDLSFSRGFAPVTLARGELLIGTPGTGLVLSQGGAVALGTRGTSLIRVNGGEEMFGAKSLAAGAYYLCAAPYTGAVAAENDTVFLVDGYYAIRPAYPVRFADLAGALSRLGLFRGTENGFELDMRPTRIQALIMLVRLLGQESAALAETAANPFADVPAWAASYTAYAYRTGLTKGVSASEFAPDLTITADEYLTYLLRALGYTEQAGDFVWSTAAADAVPLGVLTSAETALAEQAFYRDSLVYFSYFALDTTRKDSQQTLLARLIAEGSVTEATAKAAREAVFSARLR